MKSRYEQLEHTADLALRVYGADLRELFVNAAYAMFSQLADIERVSPSSQQELTVEADDCGSLLVNWLNELLFLHETRGEVYSAYDIHELSAQRLRATLYGQQANNIYTIIKAATYYDLAIEKTAQGYVATIVFDI